MSEDEQCSQKGLSSFAMEIGEAVSKGQEISFASNTIGDRSDQLLSDRNVSYDLEKPIHLGKANIGFLSRVGISESDGVPSDMRLELSKKKMEYVCKIRARRPDINEEFVQTLLGVEDGKNKLKALQKLVKLLHGEVELILELENFLPATLKIVLDEKSFATVLKVTDIAVLPKDSSGLGSSCYCAPLVHEILDMTNAGDGAMNGQYVTHNNCDSVLASKKVVENRSYQYPGKVLDTFSPCLKRKFDETPDHLIENSKLFSGLRESIPKKERTNNWTHNYFAKRPKKAIEIGTEKFVQGLIIRSAKDFTLKIDDILLEKTGLDLTLEYFQKSGFSHLILVKDKLGLDMTMPGNEFTFSSVVEQLGPNFMLSVIDVSAQKDGILISLEEFLSYLQTKPRDRILNVISLEISDTVLDSLVIAPHVIRKLSWVDKLFDIDNIGKRQYEKPKVQKYCLMSAAGSYTDFHVDFGGSSVWYHVVKGTKIFFFIEPSEENLNHFEKWTNARDKSTRFLGDELKCCRVVVTAGNTMFMPSGWIHGVFTPEDSLVFGGNFLHYLAVESQFGINAMEERLKTPARYRFPQFSYVCLSAFHDLMIQIEDGSVEDVCYPGWMIAAIRSFYHCLQNLMPMGGTKERIQEHEERDPLEILKFAKVFLKRLAVRE